MRKLLSLLALLMLAGTTVASADEGSDDPDISGTTVPVTETTEGQDSGASSAAE